MRDWHRSFRGTQRLGVERWQQLLSAIVGDVATTYGEWSGNPRDFYSRSITIAGQRDDVRLVLYLVEHRRSADDPEQFIDPGPAVALIDAGAPFAVRRATWGALGDGLAAIGCTALNGEAVFDERAWEWPGQGTFNPRFDARVSLEGVVYGCEIQGPFCGYDAAGAQTWEQFLRAGPLEDVQMPVAIAAEIRAYAGG